MQLTVAESSAVFAKLHRWLDLRAREFGFFRPYATERGGVHPEPWHLSYAPLAEPYADAHSAELLRSVLLSSGVALKDDLSGEIDQTYENYFMNIDRF